jgi:hypothetical protein
MVFMPYIKYLRKDENERFYLTSLKYDDYNYDPIMSKQSRTYGTKEELLAYVHPHGKIIKIIDETKKPHEER